jgi:hypothetical protein
MAKLNFLLILFFLLNLFACNNRPSDKTRQKNTKGEEQGLSEPQKIPNTNEEPEPRKTQNKEPEDTIDNEFVKIEKGPDGVYKYEIKKAATKPALIQKNGSLLEVNKIEDISYNDFLNSSYLLLPKDNFLLDNPFKDQTAILVLEPLLWGHKLSGKKNEHESVLFSIEKEFIAPKLPEIDEKQMKDLFGDYENNVLGKGGEGTVYGFSFKGKDYALKKNAKELENLQKLQFSDAVVRVYAGFLFKNIPYMIMEKGDKTLQALDEEGVKLSEQEVIDAVSRFERLITAQKALGIKNTDIKSANILQVTRDGKKELVIIDISTEAYTKGYHGTEGELLARTLLENQLKAKLTGGYIALARFYEFSDPQYRAGSIASPLALEAWSRKKCIELLPSNEDCRKVKNFDDLFKLLPKSKLFEIAQMTNKRLEDQTGTNDEPSYGLYRTGLPLPIVQDIPEADWQKYFEKRKEIGDKFCEYLFIPSTANKKSMFFKELRIANKSYESYCQKQPNGTYVLTKEFNGPKEPEFRQWIEDALRPEVKLNTFQQLAQTKLNFNALTISLIKDRLGADSSIGKAILEINNYKP